MRSINRLATLFAALGTLMVVGGCDNPTSTSEVEPTAETYTAKEFMFEADMNVPTWWSPVHAITPRENVLIHELDYAPKATGVLLNNHYAHYGHVAGMQIGNCKELFLSWGFVQMQPGSPLALTPRNHTVVYEFYEIRDNVGHRLTSGSMQVSHTINTVQGTPVIGPCQQEYKNPPVFVVVAGVVQTATFGTLGSTRFASPEWSLTAGSSHDDPRIYSNIPPVTVGVREVRNGPTYNHVPMTDSTSGIARHVLKEMGFEVAPQ